MLTFFSVMNHIGRISAALSLPMIFQTACRDFVYPKRAHAADSL